MVQKSNQNVTKITKAYCKAIICRKILQPSVLPPIKTPPPPPNPPHTLTPSVPHFILKILYCLYWHWLKEGVIVMHDFYYIATPLVASLIANVNVGPEIFKSEHCCNICWGLLHTRTAVKSAHMKSSGLYGCTGLHKCQINTTDIDHEHPSKIVCQSHCLSIQSED